MSQHPGPHPDHRPDEAYDRLRAADPAAHLAPDTAALDAAVRSRVGGEGLGSSTPDSTGSGTPTAVAGDELAVARARRRPNRWVAVAAVAAGTLAVGSAGYALGDRGDGDLTASPSTAAITLQESGAAADAAGGALGSPAARSAESSLAADTASSLPFFGGRTVFTAQGLSDAGGTAEAWAFDPSQSYGAEAAARAAAFLGLAGEPQLEGGTWMVGPLDGSGPGLQLQPDGLTSLSYYDPTRDPFGCAVAVPEVGADTAVEGGGSGGSAPDAPQCTPADLGTAPQGDAAIAEAREVVAGVGGDPDALEYEIVDAGSAQAVYVTGYSVLGGQRTGLVWSMTLVESGAQSVYGYLAPVVSLGTYDVISPNAAVARLSDPRFGSAGGPIMVLADDAAGAREPAVDAADPATSEVAPAEAVTPPAPVVAGSPFAWPVSDVVLTSARLGLAQHTQPSGATVLLPAYELSSADGATWSVVAVADTGLDFAAVG
jgi:hypothetical protein